MNAAHRLLLILASFAGPLLLSGADDMELNHFLSTSLASSSSRTTMPKLDPKRIINASSSFLKEREPEMNAEEYALYEKMVTMLAGNAEFAVKILEGMMNGKEQPSPAFEFILGNAYYNAGQIEKAETRYLSAVKRFPTFVRAWNNLGVLYYTAGRYADAAPCFSKSVVLGDREPTTFGLLAFSLEREGNFISAEMGFLQALSGDPDNPDWKEGLLRIYIEGKQYARAEAIVKLLVKERPQETRFWLTYADLLVQQNRDLEAIVLLELATGTGSGAADELTVLGDLYARQGLVPEALACYHKLLTMPAKGMGETKLLAYAQTLIVAGKLAEGDNVLASFKSELSPAGQIEFLQARADLFAARKSWPEARNELESLLKLAPLNGRALVALGRSYSAQNDLERATFAFEAAVRIPQATYLASLELANIELKNRHYAKSVEHLKKALSIEKSDAVEDYLARVKTLVVNDD